MPLGAALLNLFFSFLSLLKGALILGVICLPLVLLANFLRNKLKEKGLSWISSTFLACLAVVFVASVILYSYPAIMAPSLPSDIVLEEFEPSFWDSVGTFFVQALKLVVVALVLSLIVLPFVFFSSFFYSVFKDKGLSKPWSYSFAYVITFFAASLLGLFLLDRVVIALTYLFFFT